MIRSVHQQFLRQARKSIRNHHQLKHEKIVCSEDPFSFRKFSIGATRNENEKPFDRLLVVGSGVAGSAAALIAAETHKIPVTLLFAGNNPEDCNSYWAQGGIIYRNYDEGDSAELLAQDIHRAGAGLCQDDAVMKVSREGPDRVRQLLLNGEFAKVPFDLKSDGKLSLCLEASHSSPRILHYADHTGKIITEHITRAAVNHPLIQIQPHTLATDLMVEDGVCVGVHTLHRTSGKRTVEHASNGVCLASGGLGGIYQHSTNPAGFNALGSSVALAVRAGVKTQDLEYVQFHPTSLDLPNEARFLLTEALRGEGALLRDENGRAFAKDFHPDGELAPRDVVARGVFEQSQKSKVFLDITHRDRDWLHARFPAIQKHLTLRGLDLAKDMLPITPAAHYTCGGISTDLHGRTSLKGLYAAGEAARTGLHGGNRLASTSLLEGLVFGGSVADFIASEEGRELKNDAQSKIERAVKTNPSSSSTTFFEPMQVENTAYRASKLLQNLRRTLWDNVGLVRTPNGLATAAEDLEEILEESVHMHQQCPIMETCGVRDAACAGMAVTQAALNNRVSAGAHCIMSDEEDGTELVQVAASS